MIFYATLYILTCAMSLIGVATAAIVGIGYAAHIAGKYFSRATEYLGYYDMAKTGAPVDVLDVDGLEIINEA